MLVSSVRFRPLAPHIFGPGQPVHGTALRTPSSRLREVLVNEIMLLPYYIASLNQEQDDDGSLRKCGHFHDHIQQVLEIEGDLFSFMALFSPRDPVAGVDNC